MSARLEVLEFNAGAIAEQVYTVMFSCRGGIASFEVLSIAGRPPDTKAVAAHMMAAAKVLLAGA